MISITDFADFVTALLGGRLTWRSPWALALLAVPLGLVILRLVRASRSAGVALPMHDGLQQLPRSLRQRLLWLVPTCQALAVAMVIVALARPQIGEGRVVSSTEAVALQLVVDRSGSMGLPIEIDGRETTRLDAVKRVLKDFLLGNGKDLPGRPNDLIGLVQFAGFADTAAPLIRDHVALQELVEAIPIAEYHYEDGTAIGDGLALAAARLRTAEQDLKSRNRELSGEDVRIRSKAIILLTDGDNTGGERDPREAAKLAGEWGIKVYAIGIGSDSYRVRDNPFTGRQRERVRSDLNESLLRSMAEASGGKYWIASDGKTLREVYSEIDRLEKSEIRTVDYTDYREMFTAPAAMALALVILHVLLSATLLRRWP
ncbi:MAG: VWA domain-containing protein [Phycisphaerales bacterium]|nr:VWA domain-containing protein [Phycisphaerales bacterium]